MKRRKKAEPELVLGDPSPKEPLPKFAVSTRLDVVFEVPEFSAYGGGTFMRPHTLTPEEADDFGKQLRAAAAEVRAGG